MKSLRNIAITIVVILGILIAIPYLFKSKIVGLIKDQANKHLNATLNFDDDISIGLLRSFPNLSIGIDNLSLANKGEFAGDTLISAQNIYIKMDLMSVFRGDEILIKTIKLDHPRINARVLQDGRANWDITLPDSLKKPTDTTQSKFKMKLKEFTIIDGYVVYDDKQLGFYTKAEHLDHTLSGDFTEDKFDLDTKTSIADYTMGYGGVSYLSNVKTNIEAVVAMDMKNLAFVFKENKINLNELQFGLDGNFAMPGDDMKMDLKLICKQTEFKNILSLIPGIYKTSFAQVKSSGQMALAANVKGIYNAKQIPAFGVDLNIKNGSFAYPSMPSDVRNINLNLSVKNTDGILDHTIVKMPAAHAEIGKNPFDMKLILQTPVSDAQIDAQIKGIIDLAEIARIIPQEKGTEMNGILKADISANGRMSTITNKQYEKFNAKGNLEINNFIYKTASLKQPLNIQNVNLDFTPKYVNLEKFKCTIGTSDIEAKGKVENFLTYIFKNDIIKGSLDITSNYFNCNTFLSSAATDNKAPQPKDTVPLEAFSLPVDVDFVLNAKAKEVLYDNLLLNNTVAKLLLQNGRLTIENLESGMMGGKVKMDGYYDANNIAKPDINFHINMKQMDIGQISKYCASIKSYAPIANYITGNFNTDFIANGSLDKHLKPLLATLNAIGDVDLPSFKIADFEPVNQIADALARQDLKQLELKKVQMPFSIKDGKIYLTRGLQTELKGNTLKIDKDGYTALDQSIHYNMIVEIPRSQLAQADVELNNLLDQAKKQGIIINMAQKIPVNIAMTGTVTKPIVKASMKEAKAKFVDDIKNQLKGYINQKKDEYIDKGKAELEKQRKAAEDKARAEADKVKQQAEQKAKEEADRAKKKAQEELDKQKQNAKDKAKDAIKGKWKL
ncbi:MAG: AsmA family protein [Bacteroidota bacterium]|nr:AsmA family protein [Bacteroidota bacterium]